MSALALQVRTALSEVERASWIEFWRAASRSHPRQHPDFASVLPSPRHRTLFVTAIRRGALAMIGQFTIRPSRLLGGGSLEALCRRGPVIVDPADMVELTPLLEASFRRLRVGRLRITPRWLDADAVEIERALSSSGWRCQGPSRVGTGLVELGGDMSAVLKSFSQSTRAQIRLAERRGVTIEPASFDADFEQFFDLLDGMCRRRALPRLSRFEHDATMSVLRGQALGVLLVAKCAGRVVGGVSVLRDSQTAYPARYALSSSLPPSLRTVRLGAPLFWAGMRWAASQGCALFDVEGYDPERLKSSEIFQIDAFKSGFRPRSVQVLGAFIRTCFPPLALVDETRSLLSRTKWCLRRLSVRCVERPISAVPESTPALQQPCRRAGTKSSRAKATAT